MNVPFAATGFSYRYSQTSGGATANLMQEYDWDPAFPGWCNDICTYCFGPLDALDVSLMPGYARPYIVYREESPNLISQGILGVVQSFTYRDVNNKLQKDVLSYPVNGALAGTKVKAKIITDPNAVYSVQWDTSVQSANTTGNIVGRIACMVTWSDQTLGVHTTYRDGSAAYVGITQGGVTTPNISFQTIFSVNYTTWVPSSNMNIYENTLIGTILGFDPLVPGQDLATTLYPIVLVKLQNIWSNYNQFGANP